MKLHVFFFHYGPTRILNWYGSVVGWLEWCGSSNNNNNYKLPIVSLIWNRFLPAQLL